MTPAKSGTGNEARSLIIVSKDYGELGMAVSLLRGQEFAARARMLLPDSLYATNKGTLPVPASRYATLEDILARVHSYEPDLLFLFSGYLLVHDELLSTQSLDTLVECAEKQGCCVVTSDPFLGLVGWLPVADLDLRMLFSGRPRLTRWMLQLKLFVVRQITLPIAETPSLEDKVHLYPTSVPKADVGDRSVRLSFFNPTMIHTRAESDAPGRDTSRAKWLFVLSSTDLAYQRMLLGLSGFSRLVARMLNRAVRFGKLPTLIGPPAIVEPLSNGLSDLIELLSFCPFAEFESRVLEAEYAFYWNAFSFSALSRLASRLPVFVFDRGHLSRAIRPFYDLAASCHFGGWTPPFLDHAEPLDLDVLADLAEEQELAVDAVRERWQTSPTPDSLVDQILLRRLDDLGTKGAAGDATIDPERYERLEAIDYGDVSRSSHGNQEPELSNEEAAEIVRGYSQLLNASTLDGTKVWAASRLPDSKLRVETALFRLLYSITEPDEQTLLRNATMLLAYFQEGVDGEVDLDARGPGDQTWRSIVEAELGVVTDKLFQREL